MCDPFHRQLPALALALLFMGIAPRSFAEAAPQPTAEQELQAANLLEAAVFAREPSGEDLKKMRQIYADLDAKYPSDAAVKNAFAEFLWTSGEHEAAVMKWSAAEQLDPKNARVLDHLGGAYLAHGDARTAAKYFTRAIEAEPGGPDHHFNAANVIFMFRHELEMPEAAAFELATHHFAEASRLAPDNADYARAYAEVFYTTPKPDWGVALAAWEHFRKLTPDADFALANLARVHMKLGDKSAARACLSQIQSAEFNRLKTRLLERIENE